MTRCQHITAADSPLMALRPLTSAFEEDGPKCYMLSLPPMAVCAEGRGYETPTAG